MGALVTAFAATVVDGRITPAGPIPIGTPSTVIVVGVAPEPMRYVVPSITAVEPSTCATTPGAMVRSAEGAGGWGLAIGPKPTMLVAAATSEGRTVNTCPSTVAMTSLD